MSKYGYCYSSTGSRCSGRAQPGTIALRAAIRALFPIFGDLGIYNCRPSSGGGGLSTHGEGRGWDCKCNALSGPQLAAGNKLANLLVTLAQELGIQRIIWNRRQWDSRSRIWRPYHGQSPHIDHLHIELCWAAARDNPLTEEYVQQLIGGEVEDMKPEDWQRLEAFVHKEVGMLAAALLEKDNEKAQAGGSHFDTPRGESVMDVAVSARNHARKAAENTATPPAPPAPPIDAGDPDPVTPEDPDVG